jgi:hypothetical protein
MSNESQVVDDVDTDWDSESPSGVQLSSIANESQPAPKKPSKRTKRDWTGFDILRVYLRPKVHDELNARVAITHLAQSDIIEAGLAAYLRVQPKPDEQLEKLLKLVLPHDLFASTDAARSAARTSWLEVIKGALVKATQAPAPEPFKREPPRPTTIVVSTPRVTEGFIPGTTVTDHSS